MHSSTNKEAMMANLRPAFLLRTCRIPICSVGIPPIHDEVSGYPKNVQFQGFGSEPYKLVFKNCRVNPEILFKFSFSFFISNFFLIRSLPRLDTFFVGLILCIGSNKTPQKYQGICYILSSQILYRIFSILFRYFLSLP